MSEQGAACQNHLRLDLLGAQAAVEQLAANIIEGNDGLEDRCMGHGAWGAHSLYQLVERQLGVLEGLQQGAADPGQQLCKAAFLRQAGPKRQHVDKCAHQMVQLGRGPAQGWHAHHNVALTAPAPKQQLYAHECMEIMPWKLVINAVGLLSIRESGAAAAQVCHEVAVVCCFC